MFRLHALYPWLPLLDVLCEEPGAGGGGGSKKALADVIKEHGLQDEFNDILEARLARERRKLAGGGGDDGMTDKERKELADLREKQSKREQEDAERKAEYDKALGVERERFTLKEQAAQKKHETLVGELRSERVRGKIVAAAARLGAVDPDDIASLLESRVTLDDSFRASVRDAKDPTKPATNADGNDMSIDELVTELLDRKPHLVKASTSDGGSKARGSDGGGDDKRKKTQDPEIAELEKALADAQKAATEQRTTANVTRVQKAATALQKAKEAKAAKAA